MKTYAVYDRASGRLLYTGKVLPDPMPEDQAFRAYPAETPHAKFWDEAQRAFIVPEEREP